MRLVVYLVIVGLMLVSFFIKPVFVMAKSVCYVDKYAKDGGVGNKDKPYKKITKALDKGCKNIIVDKGTYKDDIVLGSNVKITGKNRDSVIIIGKVKMKDGSELDKITISGSGIEVAKGADVDIENSKIKDTHIGIETVGNGTLTVEDTSLSGNRKAMYLQRGKNVRITGCKVYNNSEEGIDIRANVDGIISGNEIYSNGESGIEVILGKSDLKIYDNKIKKNGASGIAAQYYKESNTLGGVTIKNNVITRNKDFGINCKVPSGGNPGVEYWTKSMQMTANKVYDNKDGEFSDLCYFDDDKIKNATKIENEQEHNKEKVLQLAEVKKEQTTKKEQEKLDKEQKEQEQVQLREKLQQEKSLQREVTEVMVGTDELYKTDLISQEKVKSRSSIFLFFVGPDYKELQKIAMNIAQYDQHIEQASSIKNNITKADLLEQSNDDIAAMMQRRDSMYHFVEKYNDGFSLFGWIFKKGI